MGRHLVGRNEYSCVSRSLNQVDRRSRKVARFAARLEDGGSDGDLAAELDALAANLGAGEGNAITLKRRAALGETLAGIAARLR